MKPNDIRNKDVQALTVELGELLKAHFGLRMKKATQQLNNHSVLSKTRRDIARVKTALSEKKRNGSDL